jgi:hypothetical protein
VVTFPSASWKVPGVGSDSGGGGGDHVCRSKLRMSLTRRLGIWIPVV